ncbi:MAG: hypothetical protein ACRENV_08020 [Candidatus Dormibacteria bacterium]
MLALVLGATEVAAAVFATYLIWTTYGAGLAVWELAWLGAAPVGAMTAALRPRHPVGWLLLGIAASGILSQLGFVYNPSRQPTVPQALVADSGMVLLIVAIALVGLLVLVFPSGRLDVVRRHRWIAGLGGLLLVVSIVGTVTEPTISSDAANLVNPLALPHAWPLSSMVPTIVNVATAALVGFLLMVAVNLVLRMHRAQGVQRQQIKWLAYASLTLAPAMVITLATSSWWSPLALVVAPNTVFLSVGLAIVRYHLYDVDRVLSRAVAYLLVLGLLAGVYVGSVLLFSDVLPLRGSISVALAVLVAVALLAPVRRWMRDLVDRRFNRSRYDAQAVVRAFASRVGDEVAVETISRDLLGAVQLTVEPAHAGLWVRPF